MFFLAPANLAAGIAAALRLSWVPLAGERAGGTRALARRDLVGALVDGALAALALGAVAYATLGTRTGDLVPETARAILPAPLVLVGSLAVGGTLGLLALRARRERRTEPRTGDRARAALVAGGAYAVLSLLIGGPRDPATVFLGFAGAGLLGLAGGLLGTDLGRIARELLPWPPHRPSRAPRPAPRLAARPPERP